MTAPLLCIMGPTAAGKTDAAIALAQACNAELISVDSALVYRGLEIGAAQPDYPHHLIDIRDPLEIYTAADFVDDALEAAEAIRARGKVPIFVGGTMMYFKALLDGLSEMPPTDPEVRAEIEKEAIQQGWPEMHRQLQAVDAVTAESLHPNHSQRISRALEVYRQTGVPMSHWRERSRGRSELLFVSHWHRQSDVFFMKGLSFGSIICSPTDSLTKSKRFISVAISTSICRL